MKRRLGHLRDRAWVAILLALGGCMGGCAGQTIPAKPIADARALVDSTDPYVTQLDAGLLAVEPVLIAACTGTAPLLPAAQCEPALKGYDATALALRGLQEAMVAVDATLAVLEAVAEAAK